MERRLTNKAIKHWREWLPNKYRELQENQLITAASTAARLAAAEIKELMDAGGEAGRSGGNRSTEVHSTDAGKIRRRTRARN